VELVGYGVTVGIAASVASGVGKRLLHRISNKNFRRIVIAVMVITGLAMLWQEREALGL
jgi:uncharacterized membrane protein YfcA